MSTFYGHRYHWKLQPLLYYEVSPPTQDTWYTALSAKNIRIDNYLAVTQVNDEAAAKNVSLSWLWDGVTLTRSGNVNSGATSNLFLSQSSDVFSSGTIKLGGYVALHARNLIAQIRTTSVPGTNQKIGMYLRYYTLEACP